MNDHQERTVIELYKSGLSVGRVAMRTGLSRYRVQRILWAAQVQMRQGYQSFINVQKAEAKPRGRFAHLK